MKRVYRTIHEFTRRKRRKNKEKDVTLYRIFEESERRTCVSFQRSSNTAGLFTNFVRSTYVCNDIEYRVEFLFVFVFDYTNGMVFKRNTIRNLRSKYVYLFENLGEKNLSGQKNNAFPFFPLHLHS